MNIERQLYVNKIKSFIGTEQIKVITGIRRCGKSYLMDMIAKNLNVDANHIIKLSMEDLQNQQFTNTMACYNHILSQMPNEKAEKYYVFIDEVQNINEWEKVVTSLRLKNAEIFITGSNSKLLSSELATLLAGRYIAFNLYTLSFAEYFNAIKTQNTNADKRQCLNYYIEFGSYPLILANNFTLEQAKTILSDIFNSTILKDVIARNNIKDETLLLNLINFLLKNTGNLISTKKIVDYLVSTGTKTSTITINAYINALEKAFIIERCPRYDIKGKEILKNINKFYFADHSLIQLKGGSTLKYIAQIMENIVFNNLRSKGFNVYVGKLAENEVDFIAEQNGNKIYVQVCYSLLNEETFKREIEPLQKIHDNFPKYIVTMDALANGNENGIKIMHLADFLTIENYF